MRVVAEIGEQAAVDLRVQRLDPAVEHLGRPGDVFDARDRDARGFEGRRRVAGRHDLDAEVVQTLGEVDQSVLVVDRQQCPFDLRSHAFAFTSAPSTRLHELFDHVGIQPALHFLDAFVQGLLGVVVEDGHGFLGEDRPGVDVLGDEMDGRARDLDPELERVAYRVPTLERRAAARGGCSPPARRTRRRTAWRGSSRSRRWRRGRRRGAGARRRRRVYRRRGRSPGRSRCARRARPRRRVRGRCRGRRRVDRRARTTIGRFRPSRARRMVPLPDARTPTRMPGTLSRVVASDFRQEIPRFCRERCFTSR